MIEPRLYPVKAGRRGEVITEFRLSFLTARISSGCWRTSTTRANWDRAKTKQLLHTQSPALGKPLSLLKCSSYGSGSRVFLSHGAWVPHCCPADLLHIFVSMGCWGCCTCCYATASMICLQQGQPPPHLPPNS